ncbi:MAG: phage/plasmid primase, P4 family [Pseudomonadota bacterium]
MNAFAKFPETGVGLFDLLTDETLWAARGKDKLPANPVTGNNASTTNSKTWGDFATASERARKIGGNAGTGTMCGPLSAYPGYSLGGIDIDGCRDPETGEIAQWAETLIDRLGSYAETSPSRRGVHILFAYRDDDADVLRKEELVGKCGKNFSRGDRCEIAPYLAGKFLTYTGNPVGLIAETTGCPEKIKPVSLDDLRWLFGEYGPEFKAGRADDNGHNGDQSGSGVGWRFACDHFRIGATDDEVREAFEADGDDAGEWWQRIDRRQRDRTLENALKRISSERATQREALALQFDEVPDDAERLETFGFDHDGVIRAFEARHKDELRFNHDNGSWLYFNENVWRPERTKLAHHFARDLSTTISASNPKARALRNVAAWEAIERGARSVRRFATRATDWDQDPYLLGTPGGTVDLTTGDVRHGCADDLVSRVTATSPIPMSKFDPREHCPRWLRFLSDALDDDDEAISFLQRWAGFSLTGDTREQALLFVHGPGGSGKSTAINTIAEVMGEYSISLATSTITASRYDAHPEELARLNGPRLAFASETEKGQAWRENRIKQMTGGDTITARYMRQDSFDFCPQFKLTIVGNNQPSLSNVDTAFKRRFIILPFDHPPAKKDPELSTKLRDEFPGILSWMIRGCLDWSEGGLQIPEVSRRATEAYFSEQDVFAQWISERCELDGADSLSNLWGSWEDFARSHGEDPGTKIRGFPESLSQRGFSKFKDCHGIRGRGYQGIRVANVTGFEDDGTL